MIFYFAQDSGSFYFVYGCPHGFHASQIYKANLLYTISFPSSDVVSSFSGKGSFNVLSNITGLMVQVRDTYLS